MAPRRWRRRFLVGDVLGSGRDMKENLPSAIRNYFSGKNARDFTMAASGFSSSAIVKDEGHDHQGPDAIRTWIAETAAKYDDRAEFKTVSSSGDNVEVTAEISGKFPGSPVRLRFKFTLENAKISRLEIAP